MPTDLKSAAQTPENLPYPKNANGFWTDGTWGEAILATIEGQTGGGMDTTIRQDDDGALWLFQFEGTRSDKRKVRQDLIPFLEEAMAKAGIEPLPIDELDAQDAMRDQMRRLSESEKDTIFESYP